jgi:hypothetical protein
MTVGVPFDRESLMIGGVDSRRLAETQITGAD